MRWRDERGATSLMMLTAASFLVMSFLALALDLSMFYVYRQRVRTAVEAATTAGAMQARYRTALTATGRDWRKEPVCTEPRPGGSCGNMGSRWKPGPVTTKSVGTWWEKEKWTPYAYHRNTLDELFPGECVASYSEGFRCESLAITDCWAEDEQNAAVFAANEAFAANQTKWDGRLTGIQKEGPRAYLNPDNRLDFRVAMTVRASIPTMLMKWAGYDHLNLVVDSEAGLKRLSPAPAGCRP